MAALVTLVGVAGGPEAGLLGSGWLIVLRTLSQMSALQAELATHTLDRLAAEVRHSTRWYLDQMPFRIRSFGWHIMVESYRVGVVNNWHVLCATRVHRRHPCRPGSMYLTQAQHSMRQST